MDNRVYGAHLANEFLESMDIFQMTWPARSPIQSPIQHIWNVFGKKVATIYYSLRRLRSLHDLKKDMLEERNWLL
ncbi:hypothetical protein TNCV_2737191 [Trichonephila clavipes]|nr:hypothetical protein TNCV_2737191 [Trichonephila clavipes]